MSILADKTQKKALTALAATLRHFDRLYLLDMTKADDGDACAARNLIEGIIQSNGYRVVYCANGKTRLKRSI